MSSTTMKKTVVDGVSSKSEMTRILNEITIDASKEEVWKVISDLGAIQSYHPLVKKSYYSTEQKEGVGAARVCEFGGGRSVEERAVQWYQNEGITLELGNGKKMPPFRKAFGRMSLEGIGDKTRVILAFEYSVKFGFLGSVMDRFMIRPQFEKVIPRVLLGLKQQLETTKGPTKNQSQTAGTVYLCPCHPEVRQPNSGKCPKCGPFMYLVPEGTRFGMLRSMVKSPLQLFIMAAVMVAIIVPIMIMMR